MKKMGEYSRKWEQIDNAIQRMRVPQGWIVRVSDDVAHVTEHQGIIDGWDWRSSIVFIPDKNREWSLEDV